MTQVILIILMLIVLWLASGRPQGYSFFAIIVVIGCIIGELFSLLDVDSSIPVAKNTVTPVNVIDVTGSPDSFIEWAVDHEDQMKDQWYRFHIVPSNINDNSIQYSSDEKYGYSLVFFMENSQNLSDELCRRPVTIVGQMYFSTKSSYFTYVKFSHCIIEE